MEPLPGNTADAPTSDPVSTKLGRIAALAEQMPETALFTLNPCLDRDLLLAACIRTRKDAAVGVDGETYEEFRKELFERLDILVNRAHDGTYRAPPVRRTYIPKGGSSSEKRPIGIPTFSDKVLQRAVAMILEPIYEHDFYDGSYGFRPGRSAHQAIDDLRGWLNRHGGGWVLDADVRKYFDTIDHAHLREFLRRRVRDGVLLRLIGKWLNAGVLEEGAISYPEEGTPQGGVISPLLANIYLHYVLDEWFEEEVSLGFHVALGPEAWRRLDRQDANGRRPHPSDDHEDRRLVSEPSPRPDPQAACHLVSEAARSLHLLCSAG